MANKFSPDWAAVHAQTYVFETDCWNKCNGFCCSSHHPDFSFQLLPAHGAAIFYFDEEYEWLAGQGLAPCFDGIETRKISLEFGAPQPLSFVINFCGLKGGCKGIINKPFHCLIYPFMPVLDNWGNLIDVAPASIFDLTAILQTGKSMCPLWKERKDHYVSQWRNDEHLLAPLRHPKIIFYLAAYKIFTENYSALLLNENSLRRLIGPEFWKAWELQYLGKRFFGFDALKKLFYEKHNELKGIYGDFL